LPPDGILPRAKFALHPSLAFAYIGCITARDSSSGLSRTLQRGTRNGITQLSQRALPIFGWAAITLGIVTEWFVAIDVGLDAMTHSFEVTPPLVTAASIVIGWSQRLQVITSRHY